MSAAAGSAGAVVGAAKTARGRLSSAINKTIRRTMNILCKCGMASTVNESKSAPFAPRIFRHSNRFLALVNLAFGACFDDNIWAVISEEGLASDEGFF